MDMGIHNNVIQNNDMYSGCTLHKVNERVDEGQILLQKQIRILGEYNAIILREKKYKT